MTNIKHRAGRWPGVKKLQAHEPPDQVVAIMKAVVVMATLAVLMWIGWLIYQQDSELEDAQADISDHASDIGVAKTEQARLDAALEKANDRLEANNLPEVPVPTTTPSVGATDEAEPGPRGLRGPRGFGPTRAQVAAAVAAECADGCSSMRQIAAAVERYCAANVCGTQGERGIQGDPGPVGPTGPGASDAQIQAQVDAYCAANPCGTPGPKGDQGEQGPAGTVVAGEYLCPDGEWLFGFVVATDGTVTLRCQQGFPVPRP